MSKFFPEPEALNIAKGIDSMLFDIKDKSGTKIILSRIAPGAIVDPHQHPEIQIGMSLSGRFLMTVDGQEKMMEPLENAYVARPNVMHAARNISDEYAIGLDIKFSNIKESEIVKADDAIFLNLVNEMEIKTGINMRFFVSRWCEIMLSSIPSGAVMPAHKHINEQIGIAVKGKYLMRVDDEEELSFDYGKVYFSPEGILHGACNPYEEEAVSLNIFIPPRYNLITRKERDALIKNGGIK